MATATFKQNDLEPKLIATLTNADGTAINLTTATAVYFLMRPTGVTTNWIRAACTVTDAANGVVRYSWGNNATGSVRDTSVVGTWDNEWEIVWPTSRPQTVPNASYNTIIVMDELD